MMDYEGSHSPMYTRFTDAENTGAPIVPMIRDTEIATDGETSRQEHEEIVLSHRLEN
jgi:hypothetical protein